MTRKNRAVKSRKCKWIQHFMAMWIAVICCISGIGWNVTGETVYADGVSSTITVLLADEAENICIQDAQMTLYKVAEFTDVANRTLVFDAQFAVVGKELDFSTIEKSCTKDNADALAAVVKAHVETTGITAQTDATGSAQFKDLADGIYLVMVAERADYTVNDFIVEVPMLENGSYNRIVTAVPKMAVRNERTTHGKVVETEVKESETISRGEDRTKETTTQEKNTKELDTTRYSGDDKNESKTLVKRTDMEKIPQTGQLKWPVPVFFVLGISFLVFGYTDYCFKDKTEHEETIKSKTS